ncbi:MAG: alkaline phosphatase family protein [Candidatus Nanopelagicales bacterium]
MSERRVSTEDVQRAVDVLCSPSLSAIVDFLAYASPDGDGSVVVANHAGAARLDRHDQAEVLHGRNPVANVDPLAYPTWADERADPSPSNERNAYPLPGRRLASFMADARAPDVVVVHTGRHFFPESGGHVGEHGSLGVIQSRAPLLLSGAGIARAGVVATHARIVDVAPTLAWLAGVDAESMHDLDGRALDAYAQVGARHVLGLLWDGAPSNWLLNLADTGVLPNVARLLDRGVAYQGGAIAEFPSVTLTNHTSALTGVGPGRHGVVGNIYVEPATGKRVVPNDATTWHRSGEWLRPGVSTVFERVSAARPGAVTASIDEPVDRGATHSTMAVIRALGGSGAGSAGASGDALTALLPDPRTSAVAQQRWVRDSPEFAWGSQIDDAGLSQVLQLWARADSAPQLTWWNSTLTDAALHAGGPGSELALAGLVDSDTRLGIMLDHLDRLGVLDETVVLLTADHGFEGSDPECTGGWADALAGAGLRFRDEGAGFLYLETG